MSCSVCGSEIGFWTRLNRSQSSVCGNCHGDGIGQLRAIIQLAGSTSTFNIEQVKRWTSQFDEAVIKYHLFENAAVSLRNSLVGDIFKLVETENVISADALTLVANLIEKTNVRQKGSPELRDAYLRIGMRERIQLFERGTPPIQQCNGLVLQKGENCYWEEGASMRAMKTNREFVGSSSSFSIPLGHGFRYRVGGFKGHPIDHTICEEAGPGILHITNQRLCFNGIRTSAIPYKKMISVNGFEGGFIIQTSNEKKPGIFMVRHPEFTAQMLMAASNPPAEPSKAQTRARSIPTAS